MQQKSSYKTNYELWSKINELKKNDSYKLKSETEFPTSVLMHSFA